MRFMSSEIYDSYFDINYQYGEIVNLEVQGKCMQDQSYTNLF